MKLFSKAYLVVFLAFSLALVSQCLGEEEGTVPTIKVKSAQLKVSGLSLGVSSAAVAKSLGSPTKTGVFQLDKTEWFSDTRVSYRGDSAWILQGPSATLDGIALSGTRKDEALLGKPFIANDSVTCYRGKDFDLQVFKPKKSFLLYFHRWQKPDRSWFVNH